ncbi:MAG: hypothetical protein H6728_03965 [Myxococcales bacterium]|nr:hypothetical protein [Myxococcales bacterium]
MNSPTHDSASFAQVARPQKSPCDLRLLTALEDALHTLGLTSADVRLMAFFPLVYVAWSDGSLQKKESKLIMDEAIQWGLSEEELAILSDQWLACKPTEDFDEAGLFLIEFLFEDDRRLVAKGGPCKAEIISMAERVGRVAGGLFDLLFTLEGSEREALKRLRQAMHLDA